MKPGITCLCPTYGRTHLLQEALTCFLEQDYDGPLELLILNDLPAQTLYCNQHGVRVINTYERFANLGQKMNAARAEACHPLLANWGDDDIHLPWRLSRLSAFFDGKMVQEGSHFYVEGQKPLKLNTFSPSGCRLVSSELWDAVGGMPPLNCGEDQAFNTKVCKHLGRALIHASDSLPGFIYRWGTGYYHISGYGMDSPQKTSGYDRLNASVMNAIETGREPRGNVTLVPAYHSRDWVEEARNASH